LTGKSQGPLVLVAVVACSWFPAAVSGNPLIAPGDAALRADIQALADYGIVKGPVTSWPLAWGPLLADIEQHPSESSMPAKVLQALTRVRARARWEAEVDAIRYGAHVAGAENLAAIRSFGDTPRETAEVGAGFSWTGQRLSINVNAQAVSSPEDDKQYRADNSMVGVALGNFWISASTLDRWWGPGWDGSLVLSSNARPIPALALERNFTEPFATRWLSWLGPWDVSALFGRLESDRVVAGPQFMAFRFNFRPLPSLEVGLTRTAQWCGDGRPCNLEAFTDLLLGRDNLGDAGIGAQNEPGNQLAGVDFRWGLARFRLPLAVYGQFIGEDEAGGFPSRFLAQFGAEASGLWRERWSWRWFGEVADTSCGFYESEGNFNCAYNHGIYQTGYRYRGHSIGHGADNDARVLSTGLLLVDADETEWQVLARYGELNRGGTPDPANSLTATKQDFASLDVSHSRMFRYGVIEIGVGIERMEEATSSQSDNNVRAFVQWRTSK
jgi:hypothetical protein